MFTGKPIYRAALRRGASGQFKFTDTAVTQIKSRAHELYNQLERQRIEMGLGEFDNSRPPEVNNLFNNLGEFTPILEYAKMHFDKSAQ